MSSPVLSFPAAERQQWQDVVSKALKGASADSLRRTDEDGLDIEALYQIEWPADTDPSSVSVHRLTANPARDWPMVGEYVSQLMAETKLTM